MQWRTTLAHAKCFYREQEKTSQLGDSEDDDDESLNGGKIGDKLEGIKQFNALQRLLFQR